MMNRKRFTIVSSIFSIALVITFVSCKRENSVKPVVWDSAYDSVASSPLQEDGYNNTAAFEGEINAPVASSNSGSNFGNSLDDELGDSGSDDPNSL